MPTTYDQDFDSLDQDIKTMRVEFERFFNGDLDVPPEELRDAIRSKLTALRNANKKSAESFLLSGLEARFHSYSDLFSRRLRSQEKVAPPREPKVQAPTVSAKDSIVLGARFEADEAVSLYHHLYRKGSQGKPVDLDSFTTYLRRQHELIRDRTGCDRVCFRVVQEGGKQKLKALPMREVKT